MKFACCNESNNGAMLSRSSRPGSHSLLIISTHPHEGDGCVCAAKHMLLMKAAHAETHTEED